VKKIVIGVSHPWFQKSLKSPEFEKLDSTVITNREGLNLETLLEIDPDYIFFPHWNWKVEEEIFSKFKCVVFHTAPLPIGRGGSPIQNLILRGFTESPIHALEMADELDSGAILSTRTVSLDGSLNEIFERCAPLVQEMIVEICEGAPTRTLQLGTGERFTRLSPEIGDLSRHRGNLRQLFDKIRMLDAEGYPSAHFVMGDYLYEFSDAEGVGSELHAKVRITRLAN
jgi:methionyl-tRNA formyltransferase